MSTKRKVADVAPEAGPSSKAAKVELLVNPKRVRTLKDGAIAPGPVIYWMSRDQRMNDNWALLHAIEVAQATNSPVAVCFNLVPAYLGAGARQFGFMLRGLQELQPRLATKNIQFFMLQGDPAQTIPQLVVDCKAGLLVTDYGPLRLGRQWRQQISEKVTVPFHEVDAHNVVPAWVVSEKRETAARTMRPKVHKALPEFLTDYPEVPTVATWDCPHTPEPVAWAALLEEVLRRGADVPEVTWCKPGEDGAMAALYGPQGFLSAPRLALYDTKRNDPCTQNALSGLSPWLHFGQLSAQRAALEANKHRGKYKASVDGFLEELVVRRELADNFCHHCPDTYDNLGCAAQWARDTLDVHRRDKREFIYTREQFEFGQTYDELWNACQLEMVHLGKMHGFMRMYWAKKILEWTESPEDAINIAIYLNDKYEIDGRDPNGYVGIMWSMAGIHDMGWTERPIFGKIRYMNYNGCKRKFNIPAYCAYVAKAVAEVRKGNRSVAPSEAAPGAERDAFRPAAPGEASGSGTGGSGGPGSGIKAAAAGGSKAAAESKAVVPPSGPVKKGGVKVEAGVPVRTKATALKAGKK